MVIDLWSDGEREFTLSEIFGMFWNCTDTMPRLLCQLIGDFDVEMSGWTYACGARALQREVEAICAKARAA